MATFVWVGNDTAQGAPGHTDIGGVSGATYGDLQYLSQDNYWNDAKNWRERVSGGVTGNTGGEGSTGMPGPFYYQLATRFPYGGDDVILSGLTANALDGITQDYPVSELLYGGISGSQGWYNSPTTGTGGNSGECSILVENSYFDGRNITKMPFERTRLGKPTTGATGNARGHKYGLNLYTDNFIIDSRESKTRTSYHTQIRINGLLSQIENFSLIGTGHIYLSGDYYTNMTLIGEEYGNPEYFTYTNAPMVVVIGAKIGEYLGIVGRDHSTFKYLPAPTKVHDAIDKVIIAPKHIRNEAGAITFRGEINSLEVYPEENYNCIPDQGCSSWGGKSKISLESFENNQTRGLTYGTIHLKEYNSHHTIAFNKDRKNLRVGFSNVGTSTTHVDTINVLNVDAGTFETDSISGKLNVLSGNIQIDGTMDFRAMNTGGEIEVAGTSGGIKGNGVNDDGIFVASPDSTILPPAGSNVSFRELTGGATAAIQSSKGAALTKGGGVSLRPTSR
tara:strand:- start:141 stop:1655 length:1515 start_codon:yes stop_codon:yes gene_type:complete